MIKTIVLTGGPCSGKTSAAAHMERAWGGEILTVADVGKHIQQVFPRPEMQTDIGAKLAVMRHLRIATARVQDELEIAYSQVGRKFGAKLLVCDGGILDGAAYWPEGIANFLSTLNLRKEEICAGYRAIIHLQSLAISQPKLYDQLGQQRRQPPLSEARLADQIIAQVWSGHNNYHLVKTDSDKPDILRKVTALIGSLASDLTRSEQA